MWRATVAAVLMTISGPAFSQAVPLYGVGNQPCGTFIAATTGSCLGEVGTVTNGSEKYYSLNALFNQWALAFVTASNIYHADNINVDLPSVDLWVRNWCASNPTKRFVNALVAFEKEELQRRH